MAGNAQLLLMYIISTGKIGSGTKSSVELLAKEVLGIQNGRIPTALSVAIKDVKPYLNSKIDGFFYFFA